MRARSLLTLSASAAPLIAGLIPYAAPAGATTGTSAATVEGPAVTGGQKGIVTDAAGHAVIDSVTVHDLRMESMHFRTCSTDAVIKNSRIGNSGLRRPGYDEGGYVTVTP
jgi:hypothetical protein